MFLIRYIKRDRELRLGSLMMPILLGDAAPDLHWLAG